MGNLDALRNFATSAGAASNPVTAQAKSLEGGVLPDSAAAFVKARMDAAGPGAEPPAVMACAGGAEPAPATETPAPAASRDPVATLACAEAPARRKTGRGMKNEARLVPYCQTLQGVTDRYTPCNTAA